MRVFSSTVGALALGLMLFAVAADAQPQAARVGVLRPGLVVDAAAGVAYVMNPTGGIAAVDLTTGAARWTSTAAGKPLALVGNLLVAQVEPRAPAYRMEFVTLRTTARGQVVSRATTPLPSGVRPFVVESIHGTFRLTAQPSGGDVFLRWIFVPAPIRGIDDARDTVTRADAQARAEVRAGALRFRVTSGTFAALDTTRTPVPREPAWILPAEAKLRSAATTAQQYESADGQHIVASERVADDRTWDKYRWTIFNRSGQRLGELRSHISFTPFVVRDSVVVYETTPYERAGQAAEPAKLRAFSISNGREVWGVPVRELVFRGPYPP